MTWRLVDTREMRMTADEVRAAREALGLSHDGMAAELGLTPAIIRAWERGSLGVPRSYAAAVRWRRYVHDRDLALATSGLPGCGWVARFEAQPPARSTPEERKRLQAFVSHVESCPTCQARRTFVQEHFPNPPEPPVPGWVRLVSGVQGRLRRLPAWSRPAATGALIVGGLTLVRVVLLLPPEISSTRDWSHSALTALGALLGGVMFGGLIGAVWGWLTRRRKR